MYCSHCGQKLGERDNFCASCGSPVRRSDATEVITTGGEPAVVEPVGEAEPEVHHDDVATTIAIDLDGDGERELLEDLPSLDPGTGLFVVVRGPLAGARYVLDRDVTSIGRHPDANLLLDDVTVSRHHAEVRRHGDVMMLVDMGSLNGTYVGSHRVEEHPLSMGDKVQIGRFKLVYVAAGDEATA
jgi:hypothetical protein